jgi:hypothetical protein
MEKRGLMDENDVTLILQNLDRLCRKSPTFKGDFVIDFHAVRSTLCAMLPVVVLASCHLFSATCVFAV